jgi:hypothetical protein
VEDLLDFIGSNAILEVYLQRIKFLRCRRGVGSVRRAGLGVDHFVNNQSRARPRRVCIAFVTTDPASFAGASV